MEQIARHPVRPEQWEGEQPYQGLVEQIEESQTGSQTEQLSAAIITAEVKGEDQEHGGEAVVHVEQECQRTGREQGNGRHGWAVLCFGQTLIAIDGSGAEEEGEEHTSAPDAGGQGEGRLGEKGTRSQPDEIAVEEAGAAAALGHEVGENGKGQPPDEPGQPIRPGGQVY